MPPKTHHARVVIDFLHPIVDDGQFPIKRVVGDTIDVEAAILCDGHDQLKGNLLYRYENEDKWQKAPFKPLGNDIWQAQFVVDRLGIYYYSAEGAVDQFQTHVEDIKKRMKYGEPIHNALGLWVDFLIHATTQLPSDQRKHVLAQVNLLKSASAETNLDVVKNILDDLQLNAMMRELNHDQWSKYPLDLSLRVDREKAIFGAWYELFPRSTNDNKAVHGTFDDCSRRLEYIAKLGFDVVYLPPIHPIGENFRKGKNGIEKSSPDDVGSPWAIGSQEGGHKSIHKELGDLQSFKKLVDKAKKLKLEIALDLALQCAPDHPYVKEHPEWFKKNPDGTIQYAENPPKKYQDIVPFDFACAAQNELFQELKSIVTFWIDQGIRIFRVDNPHTKPFYFWEWLISEIKGSYPDTLFLAEAFTRPHVMAYLAKIGFSQSYTYFTWRNTKAELSEYLTELTQSNLAEYLRPNFWPNTPDILAQSLQNAPPASFVQRFILASTLTASYGIYGPAFELCENLPKEQGSEEYWHSEKYEVRFWDLAMPNIAPIIERTNRIRREYQALQRNNSLRFHTVDNESILAYSKTSADKRHIILVVVNLDPHNRKSGMLELPLETFGINPTDTYQLHDLLSDTRLFWQGKRNQIEIDPQVLPAHIFLLMRKARSEQEFEYYV